MEDLGLLLINKMGFVEIKINEKILMSMISKKKS
jgi:hypothetical protein